MKTAKQINTYVADLMATIEANELNTPEKFQYEMCILQSVQEELKMDSGKAQIEYLNDEYFGSGSNDIPTIKRKVNKAIKAKQAEVLPRTLSLPEAKRWAKDSMGYAVVKSMVNENEITNKTHSNEFKAGGDQHYTSFTFIHVGNSALVLNHTEAKLFIQQ